MREWIYQLLDRLTDWLVDLMIMIEPRPQREQELDYHISKLPQEILAIVRVSWYRKGKADEVEERVLYEDGQAGYDEFAWLVQNSLKRGANVSIRSGYDPKDLGIIQ